MWEEVIHGKIREHANTERIATVTAELNDDMRMSMLLEVYDQRDPIIERSSYGVHRQYSIYFVDSAPVFSFPILEDTAPQHFHQLRVIFIVI